MFYGKPAILLKLLFLILIQTFAQDKKDSLLLAAKNETDPDKRAKIFLEVSVLTFPENVKTSLEYATQASQLTEEEELLGAIWDHTGRLHFASNQFDDALSSFKKAKTYKESAGLLTEAASANNRIGVTLLRLKQHQQALEVFLESISFFEQEGDSVNLAICFNNMAGVFADMADYAKAVTYNEQALQIFRSRDLTQYEVITLPSLAGQYLMLQDTAKAIAYNLEAEKLGLEQNNLYALGIAYNNLGQLYFVLKETEKAIDYYEKSLTVKQKMGQGANLVPTYNNLGESYIGLNNPAKAITYLKKAMKLGRGEELWPVYGNLTKAYILLGKKDSAMSFFELTGLQKDSVFSVEKQKALNELLTKYETEKKEKEIIRLESEKRKTNFLLSGVSGLLIATVCIGFLFVKNNRKKRIIAQQNEKLEKQHVEQLLKEQELTGIDAMLKGQETERKKISEELHDSLGSSLSTLRLYLDSLVAAKEPAEFQSLHAKTVKMLEETYDGVRRISHDKSAGVWISKGLIPAVRATAKKISDSKKINIEVIDAGLQDKLASSVEISIFKSIQELLSNVVKHSRATEAIVQFTQHDKILNVIVEDNGVGFNPQKIRYGIGFADIRNRLEELKGTVTVDSSIEAGTTVILNVPVT